MRLNHINLTVTAVREAMDFLVKYFEMRSMGANKGMGFLTDEQDGWGFILTLMKAGEKARGKYPGTFHIGFFIESKEKVDELNRRLKKMVSMCPRPAGSPSRWAPDLPGEGTQTSQAADQVLNAICCLKVTWTRVDIAY